MVSVNMGILGEVYMYQVVIVDDEVTISEGIANLFHGKKLDLRHMRSANQIKHCSILTKIR